MMALTIDWGLWSGVVGIVATVVFGIWAIILTKSRAYPGQLTYYREPAIRLFADITANLPQITVNYKGEPAKKNLSLLRGYLVNTGTKDITAEMIAEPIQIGLADGYRWLEVSGKASFDKNEHAKIVNEKVAQFDFPMLRREEYVRFEGLMEFGEGKKFAGAVWLEHRIADTGKVKWDQVPDKTSFWSQQLLATTIYAIMIAATFGITFMLRKGKVDILTVITQLSLVTFAAVISATKIQQHRTATRIRNILKIQST